MATSLEGTKKRRKKKSVNGLNGKTKDMAYNKSMLVKDISKTTKVSQVDAKKVIDAAFETIKAKTKAGADITFQNFGNFKKKVHRYKGGTAPNGKKYSGGSKNILKFHASKNA